MVQRCLVLPLAVLWVCGGIGCGNKVGTAESSHGSTLIDRELFFGNPALASPQLSPDGRWVAFLKEMDGILNVHLVAWGSL